VAVFKCTCVFNIYAGIQQKLVDLMLSYNPLWLRIGLETVFGEVLSVHGNTDIVGLSRFILTRLLACPDIAAEFAHPNVRRLYKPGEFLIMEVYDSNNNNYHHNQLCIFTSIWSMVITVQVVSVV